jgi:hypothetical protein
VTTIWFWALVAAGYAVPSLVAGRALGTAGKGLRRWAHTATLR